MPMRAQHAVAHDALSAAPRHESNIVQSNKTMVSSSQCHGTVPFKRSEEQRRELVGKPLEKLGEKDQVDQNVLGMKASRHGLCMIDMYSVVDE